MTILINPLRITTITSLRPVHISHLPLVLTTFLPIFDPMINIKTVSVGGNYPNNMNQSAAKNIVPPYPYPVPLKRFAILILLISYVKVFSNQVVIHVVKHLIYPFHMLNSCLSACLGRLKPVFVPVNCINFNLYFTFGL